MSDSEPRVRHAGGRAPDAVTAFAPGRVNLIGEHTDYNQGLALPFAIREGVTVSATSAPHGRISVVAHDLRAHDAFDVASPRRVGGWRAFVRGAVAELTGSGARLRGARLEIRGTVPVGSGLSSSAALEVALCLALLGISGAPVPDRLELAMICSRIENDWVGARTGLLDQIASLYGEPERAMEIDFRSLEVTPVTLELAGYSLVTLDSGERHANAGRGPGERRADAGRGPGERRADAGRGPGERRADAGRAAGEDAVGEDGAGEDGAGEDGAGEEPGYNQRRDECQRACELLSISSLREATPEMVATLSRPLRDRAEHVLSENQRVRETVRALAAGDLERVGGLLNASHRSLRDCFAISTPAVEATVTRLLDAGAIGARIVGGGFGGHVLGLFGPDGRPPDGSVTVQPGPGAQLLA